MSIIPINLPNAEELAERDKVYQFVQAQGGVICLVPVEELMDDHPDDSECDE